MHSQTSFGGRVHKLSYVKATIEEERCEEEFSIEVRSYEDELKSYYILNLKDKAQFQNGFRWIKEILLQHHNFSMWEAYRKLKDVKVFVYSVKTDAFTSKGTDEVRAREVLDFNDDVGGLRIENYPLTITSL